MARAIDTSKLNNALRRYAEQFEMRVAIFAGTYVSDAGNDFHWVDMDNPDGSTGPRTKVRGRMRAWAGVRVRIGVDRLVWGESELAILGTDSTSYGTEQPMPEIGKLHGPDHGHLQPDETNSLHTLQIKLLRVQPASTPDLTVNVLAGYYIADGTLYNSTALQNIDLSAYVAALNAGEQQYLTLSIDSAGTVNVTEGTVKGASITVSDVAAVPAGEWGLAAVRIMAGDTALARDRMYLDLRFLNAGFSSTSYKIVLYSGNATEYAATDAGMALAIAAASSGDTITIPPVTLANDYSVPAGVTVAGMSISDVVLSGQISTNDGSTLEHLSVTRSKNDASTYYGVIGPDSGTAYIKECWVSVTQAGGGSGYGVSCYAQDGNLQVYGGRVFGTTADARTN
jgi:hypothetical protein